MGVWGWEEHDGANYGREVIEDWENNLRLEIVFVKGQQHWMNTFKVTPLKGNYSDPASLVYYVGYNYPDHYLLVDEHPDKV